MTIRKHKVIVPPGVPLRCCQDGARASEDSESAEKCQETGRDEEGKGPRSEDRGKGRTRVHLPGVQGEYRDRSYLVPFSEILNSSVGLAD